MPKDTVEEIAKKIMADNGGIDEVDDPKMFRDICQALTTAYNKGVEVGNKPLGIEYKGNELHIKPNSYIEKIFITKENGQTYQITLPE